MLKTGLMTWFTYNNYGTVLQLYALNSVIKQLGFDNEIINYIPKRPYKDPIINYILKHPFLFANEIIFRANNLIYRKYKHLLSSKIEKFDSFKKSEFSFSKECRTASELFQLNDRYDIFICGSDQIWSPLCFDEKYFLDYVNETRKMIAYAPSIGVDNITNEYIAERMRKLISRFEKLSVREDAGKDIIYNISRKNAQQVLDPTLLLGKDEWEDLLDDKADYVHDEKYILCYFLGNSKKYWNIVKRLSKKMNLPINVIPNTSKDYARPFNIISDVGPRDFIRLVRKAHIICTDSFHGTIFSIIFNKLFFTFPRFRKNDPKNQNSRIYCLLKSLSLEDRLIFNQRNALSKINEIVNFAPVHEILNKERKKSINYLSKSLSSIDIDLSKKEDRDFIITNTCCGCGACASVCTNQAVKVGLNENGFYESKINNDICIRCEKCRMVCPFVSSKPKKLDAISLFAAYSQNMTILNRSSSGGIAQELADYFNSNGEDVFGCIYNAKTRQAETIRIKSNEKDKLTLCGSKYLQSNMNGIYQELKSSKGGVFFGTPCQIAAVDLWLRKEHKREKILLVDLICHGVPTYLLWKNYLDEGHKKYHYGENPQVKFRLKKYGWRKKCIL
jgi:ferredoxin